MSGTVVRFSDGYEDLAAVYVHGDVNDAQETLREFFLREETRIGDWSNFRGYGNRFDDAEYLAARFVAHTIGASGTGVGVTVNDAEGDEGTLRVTCLSTEAPDVAVL